MKRSRRPSERHKNPPRTKSGYKGVIYQNHTPPLNKPWKTYARKNGQYHLIGYFATKQEAAKRYNEAAVKIHGPDTYLNPI